MLDREQASALLLAPPFRLDSRGGQRQRSRSLGQVLDWLAGQPGATWQERWAASGAEACRARLAGDRRRLAHRGGQVHVPATGRAAAWAPGCSC